MANWRLTRTVRIATITALSWVCASLPAAGLTASTLCEKTKNTAAANYIGCIARQRGAEIVGKTPDYTKCTTKLMYKFTTAEECAVARHSSCPTTGDAAAVLARLNGIFDPTHGLPKWFSNTRFVDNGDGTVSDTLTGLMWEQKDNLDGTENFDDPHDADNSYTWTTVQTADPPDGTVFTDFLHKLNNCYSNDGLAVSGGFAGHCDWRLPTILELETIADVTVAGCGSGSPCISSVFGPTPAESFWSLTNYVGPVSPTVWALLFDYGTLKEGRKDRLGTYVRAVRSAL